MPHNMISYMITDIALIFMTLYRRQGLRWFPIKKCKKAKWLSEETLQIVEKSREAKGKGEKERYTDLNAESQRIAG